MLVVEIDKKGHVDRDPDYEKKRWKELKNLPYNLIRINPDKIDFNDYEEFGRVPLTLLNQLKNKLKNHWLMIFQKDF